jgi:CheY-like chemotaxis protein
MTGNDTDLTNLVYLVIDDSKFTRKIIKNMLVGLGLRNAELAADATQGLEALKAKHIDLVIVDREMPILNGVEFTRLVRRDKSLPDRHIPIVMASAHTEKNKIIEARDAGVNEFIAKPFSAGELHRRIRNAFNSSPSAPGSEPTAHLKAIA